MNIIIYGAGGYSNKVLKLLNNDNVLCFIDADPSKIGGGVAEYLIISPKDIKNYNYDLIVISLEDYNRSKEIRDQLINLGIESNKIIHWTHYAKLSKINVGSFVIDWDKVITFNDLYPEMCNHLNEISKLEREFLSGHHNRSHKLLHYFEVYNRHFEKFYNKDINIMEIGVNEGGSLQLWKKMFSPKSKIIGLDINPNCKSMEDEQIDIYIGDQSNREFWSKIKSEIPKLDILIDDGGHTMEQQIVTFEEMFPHVKDGGVYLCEDVQTSYREDFGGGFNKPDTFINYSKSFIDHIHAWNANDENLPISQLTRSIHSVHYYNGIIAIEKRSMYPPFTIKICNNEEKKYIMY